MSVVTQVRCPSVADALADVDLINSRFVNMGARTTRKISKVSPLIAPIVVPRGSTVPIKVQKPKQPRKLRNNVKTQGRPQQLSSSQMRKLIRLYLLTNLQLGAIRELVLCFGEQDIKYVVKSKVIDRRQLKQALGKAPFTQGCETPWVRNTTIYVQEESKHSSIA